MRRQLKIVAYLVLSVCLIGLAMGIYSSYPAPDQAPASLSTNQISGGSDETAARPSSKSMGRVMAYGGVAFLCVVGLGLLIARDFSHFAARQVERFIFNDNLEETKDPEYEEAEQVWANGNHLEAVRLMREYLDRHPREQYVALRIAEIYEKDLNNPLAAALEYEEILKKKLPPERWGWAAIHLANLYSGKLDKPQPATALLERIIHDYGQTAAAKKARERLGIPESSPEAASPPKPEDTPPSNLPPGFRPK